MRIGRPFSVRAWALMLGAMFMAPSVTLAVPVTYAFSGTIHNFFPFTGDPMPMPDGLSFDGLGFDVGSTYTGFATYDPDAVCDGAAIMSRYSCNTQPMLWISLGDVSFSAAPEYFAWDKGDTEGVGPVNFFSIRASEDVAFLPRTINGWQIRGNGEASFGLGSFRVEIAIETVPGVTPYFGNVYVLSGDATDLHRVSGPTKVPEPASLGLLSIGLAGLLISRRRRSA